MTRGKLVLVFDDCSIADRKTVRPILQDLAVPAAFAVVPTWLGQAGFLHADDVRTLVDDGHEILAHGRRHRYLQPHHLAADAMAGDRTIALQSGHAFPKDRGGVLAGDEYELFDGDRREAVTVSTVGEGDGEDGTNAEVRIETALDSGFAAATTVFRVTEGTLRDEVIGARNALQEIGVDPEGFVFPYDAADARAWSLAAEEYPVLPDTATRSLPNPPGAELTNLRRWYFETDHFTPGELGDYLDLIGETGGIGVLAGHSDWDTVTRERIETVVTMARDHDVEVTTFRDLRRARDVGR